MSFKNICGEKAFILETRGPASNIELWNNDCEGGIYTDNYQTLLKIYKWIEQFPHQKASRDVKTHHTPIFKYDFANCPRFSSAKEVFNKMKFEYAGSGYRIELYLLTDIVETLPDWDGE